MFTYRTKQLNTKGHIRMSTAIRSAVGPRQKVRSGHNIGQINLPGVARGGRSIFQLLPNGAFSMPHL